ncbi:MAG: hypothetical protein ABI855_14485 [Bacteroidota bacterium]
MTDKGKVVLKGLLELSESERMEVIREAMGFKDKTFSEQRSLNESISKALNSKVLGPTSDLHCPCCGR